MQKAPAAEKRRWPALLPVILVSAASAFSASEVLAQDARLSKRVYSMLLTEEARVARALESSDARSLDRSADVLGRVVDNAFARKKMGLQLSSCELAAQSLAHVALLMGHDSQKSKDWQEIVIGPAIAEAKHFKQEMTECEREIGVKARDHGGVVKVLRALSENGET